MKNQPGRKVPVPQGGLVTRRSASRLGEHAVVVGSGIGGLLAARTLSDHFSRVTVLERDPEPRDREGRKGVPQGRQAHVLLLRGQQILESLLPGLKQELRDAGSAQMDFAADYAFHHHGHWMSRFESRLEGLVQTRPFLENIVRRRVDRYPSIRFQYRTLATGLSMDSKGERVTGLFYERREDDVRGRLDADLVIDTSGRASRVSRWLTEAGYTPPQVQSVWIGLGYASRLFRRTDSHDERGWRAMAVYPRAPDEVRGGYVLPVEGDRWLVSAAGYTGCHPPTDDEGFLRFLADLPQPDIHEHVRRLEPISEIAPFKFPAQVRIRYDKLRRYPKRLLVLGDALCYLDPLFGQGMSLGALQVAALGHWLDAEPGALDTTPRLQKHLAKLTRVPWRLSLSEAFRHSGVRGKRPLGTTLTQRYFLGVFELSSTDDEVYSAFLNVAHLIETLGHLFRPRILAKVVRKMILRPMAGGALKWLARPRERTGPVARPLRAILHPKKETLHGD